MGARERSPDVEDQLHKIDILINNEQFDEARRSILALAEQTKCIPALLGANAMLTMLGEEQADLDSVRKHNA